MCCLPEGPQVGRLAHRQVEMKLRGAAVESAASIGLDVVARVRAHAEVRNLHKVVPHQ